MHSELMGHATPDPNLNQYDYCRLVANTLPSQQYNFHQIDFALLGAFFSLMEHTTDDEKIDSTNFTVSLPAMSQVPRTILYQSFLI